MKGIQTLKNIKGKRVLVRVDFNVPLSRGKVRDEYRINAALKTIKHLKKLGAVQILVSHLGESQLSLKPIAKVLQKKIPLQFLTEKIGSEKLQKKLAAAKPGGIFLLENIRHYEGEEKNDAIFAQTLASLASLYVNDAFSVSHRKHASIVGVPKLLPAYAGLQLQAEVLALGSIVRKPLHPFIFILGGAKFSTKIPLIERYAKTADKVVIVGAILNSFYQTAGFEVGSSVIEAGYENQIKEYLQLPNMLLPVDVVVERRKKAVTISPNEVQKKDVIVDIGPQTIELLRPVIAKAKVIIWNGPLGWYEKGFMKGTIELGKLLAKTKAQVVVGGGDTVTVLGSAFAKKKNIFVSTGGGATIEYLAKGTIPGVELL